MALELVSCQPVNNGGFGLCQLGPQEADLGFVSPDELYPNFGI